MLPSGPSPLRGDALALAGAVAVAQANADLMADVADIYASLDAEIAALDPLCWGSGACCRFDQAGHKLYVSTAELAYLVSQRPLPQPVTVGRCPYQVGPRCRNRSGRPLGCRVYFCDESLRDSLEEIYARYHRRIVEAHSRISLEYRYLELTEALASLASAPTP